MVLHVAQQYQHIVVGLKTLDIDEQTCSTLTVIARRPGRLKELLLDFVYVAHSCAFVLPCQVMYLLTTSCPCTVPRFPAMPLIPCKAPYDTAQVSIG
jgi:hypothetical protein